MKRGYNRSQEGIQPETRCSAWCNACAAITIGSTGYSKVKIMIIKVHKLTVYCHLRFCVDYRRVNAVSKKDAYPLPNIQDALDNLQGSRSFATIDLLSGYRQLGMTDRAKERSAFCTRRGLFQFTRMPFGLSGAPGSFCRLMEIVLSDLNYKICLCYLTTSSSLPGDHTSSWKG